ncbi:MAG TPA: aromatic ring-hydroxylating dioxygenase subunit alpha, partial [Chloroflexi bacterium]|nr:aromatic ring-hydroxylating dioxygenase subunit alpha [Chloroflexota bacterium]
MSLSTAEKRLHPKLKFGPDAATSATLPAHYYYDPDIYEREKQEIFYKTWQFVGYLRDLQQPGDYITAEIIDQKILVTRGKDDVLRAFYNVCMHRGHVLAEGRGNKSIFTCPFHAWSYDATGELKAAGNAENIAGFKLDDFSLSEVQIETFGGMVYVNLDPSSPSLHSIAGGLEKEFETIVPRFNELTYTRTDVFDMNCNWKFVFDQMECYHCPHI